MIWIKKPEPGNFGFAEVANGEVASPVSQLHLDTKHKQNNQ